MNYGTTEYGVIGYGEKSVNSTEIKKYFVDLTKYVSSFIFKCPETSEVLYTQGYFTGMIRYYINDLISQCFIDTATWGLAIWEEEYGIITNITYSYEERREILKAKKRGQGTTTIAMLKNIAEAFSGGEVNIETYNEDYYFVVHFIGVKGIPKNMSAFIKAIEDVKPAHLNYQFKYTYTTWQQIKDKVFTWNSTFDKTWDQIKVYE